MNPKPRRSSTRASAIRNLEPEEPGVVLGGRGAFRGVSPSIDVVLAGGLPVLEIHARFDRITRARESMHAAPEATVRGSLGLYKRAVDLRQANPGKIGGRSIIEAAQSATDIEGAVAPGSQSPHLITRATAQIKAVVESSILVEQRHETPVRSGDDGESSADEHLPVGKRQNLQDLAVGLDGTERGVHRTVCFEAHEQLVGSASDGIEVAPEVGPAIGKDCHAINGRGSPGPQQRKRRVKGSIRMEPDQIARSGSVVFLDRSTDQQPTVGQQPVGRPHHDDAFDAGFQFKR